MKNEQTPSLFSSIVQCKCPRCRKANLFTDPNHYHLKNMFLMPDRCPNCGQDFQIEPGFYLGAMWVSYPIVIGLEIAFILFSKFILRQSLELSFVIATVMLFSLTPPLIRISRSLFIHLNVGFRS